MFIIIIIIMNFIKDLLESSYQIVWKSLIRPPRDVYEDSELGQDSFQFSGRNYKRTDFSIYNHRNLKLECSIWEPYDEEREYDRLPCVIYLPGNSSSRCETIPLLSYLLPLNITVFGVDFAGCGRSEGDYISLGYYEQDDVEVIIEYLRKSVYIPLYNHISPIFNRIKYQQSVYGGVQWVQSLQ